MSVSADEVTYCIPLKILNSIKIYKDSLLIGLHFWWKKPIIRKH